MRYFDWLVAGVLVAACVLAVVLLWPLDVGKWIGLGCVLALVIVRGCVAAWGRRQLDEHPPHEDIDKPWWKSRVRMWNDWKRRY